jgi:5-methylcytosine-specific restriction endonuclease McrA
MIRFLDVQPTRENHWRALVLFGRNVATYKFALGRALLELRARPGDLVRLDELAMPYAQAICDHLKAAPKQGTSASSRFLDQCRIFNQGDIGEDRLRDVTVQLGFNNVIDAFHRLGPSDVERRFFLDERRDSNGIRLTDEMRALDEGVSAEDLLHENEARWRLVETAWEIGVGTALIGFDRETEQLFTSRADRRIDVTSSRAALNGYQKGHCFYCFALLATEASVDVDHFFPWSLRAELGLNLDGVWNLVLSCPRCNRGRAGKFDLIPTTPLLVRLHTRNEFLIGSHHPLRETLMSQTGASSEERSRFMQRTYEAAVQTRIGRWTPSEAHEPAF